MPENIITADFGKRQPIQKKRKSDRRFCHHPKIWIREKERDIECKDCGQVLSCYEWIEGWMRGDWILEIKKEELKKECEVVAEKLKDLKRLERNAKARMKRHA